ncbi:hypothetical protein EHM69_09080 [candidate division KSB1 bacterium]|nr:MAG: hypothetical protein EHM69_09080 [candidate division KSB1 bacterium]
MSRINESLMHARHETPPPGLTTDLERSVMQRIGKPRSVIKPISLTVAATVVTAALILAIFRSPVRPQTPAPQFVESIFVMDDHICIWLEPVESVPGGK